MGVRKLALTGLFGLTAACSGKHVTSYVVPIKPAETIYDSPLVSVADEGTILDLKKSSDARTVAAYVLSQHKRSGVLETKRDTGTFAYFKVSDGITIEGKIFKRHTMIGAAPLTIANSCLIVNKKKYDVLVKNVNERIVGDIDADELIITYLGDKECGKENTTIVDRGLDGRVDQAYIMPQKSNQVIQTTFNFSDQSHYADTARKATTEERRQIQKIYEETLSDLVRFFTKKR